MKEVKVSISISEIRKLEHEDVSDSDYIHDHYRVYFSTNAGGDPIASVSLSDEEFVELSKGFDLSIESVVEE